MLAVVLITCPDKQTAEEIAELLLRRRLAACVNVIPGVKSSFWWEGTIEEAEEFLLLAKTRVELLGRLEEVVRDAHPYEVPEVVALPIIASLSSYADWVRHETGG